MLQEHKLSKYSMIAYLFSQLHKEVHHFFFSGGNVQCACWIMHKYLAALSEGRHVVAMIVIINCLYSYAYVITREKILLSFQKSDAEKSVKATRTFTFRCFRDKRKLSTESHFVCFTLL